MLLPAPPASPLRPNPGICTMTREEKMRRELYLILKWERGWGGRLHLVMVFLEREGGCEAGARPAPRPPARPWPGCSRVHALAAAAEHDVGCLLGLLLLLEQRHRAQGRVAGAHLLQQLWGHGQSAPGGSPAHRHPRTRRRKATPESPPGPPTASSSSFFILRSVFILPEPLPWKRWDSWRKAWARQEAR